MKKAEAEDKIKEALKTRVQASVDKVYGHADKVIFIDKDNYWAGPGKVILKGL